MKVEVQVDTSISEKEVIIKTNQLDKDSSDLMAYVQGYEKKLLLHGKYKEMIPISMMDIMYIYACQKKVYIKTQEQLFEVRERLYELEEKLDMIQFVRISKSEIVNLKFASHFDMSYVNTISITMKDTHRSIVSRRYVAKIRKVLERMRHT